MVTNIVELWKKKRVMNLSEEQREAVRNKQKNVH